MGQRSNDAAVKGAQVKLRREECASSTGQHGQRKDAAVMVAQVLLRKDQCASGTGQRLT